MKTMKTAPMFVPLVASFALRLAAAEPPAPHPGLEGAWAIPAQRENFHVFLLMGQSNMAGYAGVEKDDPLLPGDLDPVPHVLVLDGETKPRVAWTVPDEPPAWRPGAHPLHQKQETAKFGLGLDFAREYLKDNPGATVGLIPCAVGATSIAPHMKGKGIYNNAMWRAGIAKEHGVLKGVLWHQGESNAFEEESVANYGRRLRKLMSDLRADCGEPELPFIIGNLLESFGFRGRGYKNADHLMLRLPLMNRLRGTLYEVATTDPHAAFVHSTGLENSRGGGGVHFNRASYILLGQRYARALEDLKARPKTPVAPPAAGQEGAGDWSVPATPENFHLFLLMGADDMAGHGGTVPEDTLLPEDKQPLSHVLVLDGQGTLADAKPLQPVAWRPAAHPLHAHASNARFGLGLDFAREYLKNNPGVTVGLIPCAASGAAISSLGKGSPSYANALDRLAFAKKQGVLKGVLWQQGEADIVSEALADAYEGTLRKLIADVRADSGQPHLPFMIGNLPEFAGVQLEAYPSDEDASRRLKCITRVRRSLYDVATTDPHAAFVATTGLQFSDPACIHFNRQSLITLGQRHAQAFATIDRNH